MMQRTGLVSQRTAGFALGGLVGVSLAIMPFGGILTGLGVLALGLVILYRSELREWGLHRLLWPRVWLRHPPLALGSAVLALLVAGACFPEWLAPHDPEAAGPFLLEVNGNTYAAPYPPNARYPLGSDYEARDLLSRVIHGTRATLTLVVYVTCVRMAVGMGLGLLATLPGTASRQFAHTASAVSAAFPSLLFAFLFIAAIGPGAGMPVFILGLGLTGWAHWTRLIGDEVRRIQAQPYVLAAEAIGTPPAMKFRRHILPGLLPLVLPSAAHELSAAMLLLAELGFIGVFFGEAVVINVTDLMRQTAFPEAAEWGGMLAGTRAEVFRWYWLPLVPAGAFFVSIMGFNWLASGMQQALDLHSMTAATPAALFRRRARRVRTARRRPKVPHREADARSQGGNRVWKFAGMSLLAVVVVGGVVTARFVFRIQQQASVVRQQQQDLAELLAQAQHALSVNRYESAQARFREYLVARPDDATARAGLAQAEAGLQLVHQLVDARALAQQGHWHQALPLLRAIDVRHPNYGGVGALIADGEKQLRLAMLLEAAQQAYGAEDWATAQSLFEQMQAEDREYEWQVVRTRLADTYVQQATQVMQQDAYDPAQWVQVLQWLENARTYRPSDPALQERQGVLQAVLDAHRALVAADELAAVEAVMRVRHAFPALQDPQAQLWWRWGTEYLWHQAQFHDLELAATVMARLFHTESGRSREPG